MADSQVPLEKAAGLTVPLPTGGLRLGQGGGAAPRDAATAASPHEAPAATEVAAAGEPSPIETAEQAPLHLGELNGSATNHAAAEPHEEPHPPLASDAAPQIDGVEPPLQVEPPLPVGPALPLAPDIALPGEQPQPETFTATHPEPAEPPAGHVPPPAEIVMQVSPIFSALDAADEAAAEADRSLPPVTGSDDVIALPHMPVLDNPPPDMPVPMAADADSAGDGEPLAEPPTEAGEVYAAPQHAQPEPDVDLHAAAAKIANEASATAEALESLKRLLDHKLTLLDPVSIPPPSPAIEHAPAPMPAPPPQLPIPAFHAAPRQVAPPPMISLTPAPELPMRPVREPVRHRSSIGGFLAGFALSWVIGAILYAYLAVMG